MATCRYRFRFLGPLGPVFWFGTRLYEFAAAKERNTEANPSNVVSRRSGQHGSIPSETDLVEFSCFVTNRRLAMRGIEAGFRLFGALWIFLSESQSGTSKDSDRLCFRPGHEPVLRVWERRCGACLREMIGAKSQLKRFWRSVIPAMALFVILKAESASARFVTDPQNNASMRISHETVHAWLYGEEQRIASFRGFLPRSCRRRVQTFRPPEPAECKIWLLSAVFMPGKTAANRWRPG